ncbi:hypothetical protein ABVN55_10315 [Fusobacterium animalis]|uniref:hypothetical protein n=1 Tax=Fusobacterium TaxID=848 RepID=UPI0003B8286D|nr:hypothetical protein [Fusobacterium nucleatum]ERT35053.1 hypothetical protein HMPREF1766_01528 [Fusobacterium nucleatum CTI-5]
MSLLITSGICLIISVILFTLFEYELSEKRKDILAFWSANFLLIAGLFFLRFVFLQRIKN